MGRKAVMGVGSVVCISAPLLRQLWGIIGRIINEKRAVGKRTGHRSR